MIKYVAFLKMKDDTPPEALKEMEAQLRVLGKTVAEVKGWSCGRCVGVEGSPAPGTFAIVADFQDEAGYQVYREHPQHEAFRQLIRPYREAALGMTYEANYPFLGLILHEGGIPVPVPRYRLPSLE